IYQDLQGDALAQHRQLCEHYSQALKLYRNRAWPEARSAFEACLAISEQDVASKMFLDRCDYFRESPPPEGWDGSFTMKSK
ncbi:MAG: hypothetical protein RIR18_1589, partial [Pseudomonadota bacterium]